MEKGDEKRHRHDVHSEKREDFFRLSEDGIFESVEGVDSRKGRRLADRSQITALGGVYGRNQFVACKTQWIIQKEP